MTYQTVEEHVGVVELDLSASRGCRGVTGCLHSVDDLVPQRSDKARLLVLLRVDREAAPMSAGYSSMPYGYSRRSKTPGLGLASLHLDALSLDIGGHEVRAGAERRALCHGGRESVVEVRQQMLQEEVERRVPAPCERHFSTNSIRD